MNAKFTQKVFCLLFLFKILYFSAQTNISFHNYYEMPGQMAKINNKIFFNSFGIPQPPLNYYVSPCYLYGVSGNNILFQKQILKNETTYINDMIITTDKSIVCVGNAHGCDNPGNPTLFIFKIDTTGNTIFNTDLPNGNSFQGFKKVVQYSDSSFFSINDNSLYHFDKNGIFLSKKLTPAFGNTTMALKNNHFILSSNNTVTEIDSACNIIHQATTTSFYYTKTQVYSANCIIGLTSTGIICKIDSLFNIIATSQSKQGILQLTDFQISTDTIYCSAYDTANQFAIFKIDTSFIDTASIKTNYKYILPQKIAENNNSLYLLSSENNFSSRNPNANLLSVEKSSAQINLKSDAGVIQTVVDSGYISGYNTGAPNYINYLTYYYRIKVTVKNLGADTLHQFYVNHKPYNPTNCAMNYYYNQLFNGYNLIPGQSVTITTPFISAQAMNPVFGNISTTNYTVTIDNPCFWTSAPNNKNDAKHLNDSYCIPLSYEAILLDIQQYKLAKNVKVIPNPFNENFNVNSDEIEILSIEVYSIDGKLIKKLTQLSALTISVNLSEIENGFYLLKVLLKDGQYQIIKTIKN